MQREIKTNMDTPKASGTVSVSQQPRRSMLSNIPSKESLMISSKPKTYLTYKNYNKYDLLTQDFLNQIEQDRNQHNDSRNSYQQYIMGTGKTPQ